MKDLYNSSQGTYANSRMHLSSQAGLSRLSARVREMVPVTYLRAPVGYGKSGLVDEWINERLSHGFNVVYLDAAELIEGILGEVEEARDLESRSQGPTTTQPTVLSPLTLAEELLMGRVLSRIELLFEELGAFGNFEMIDPNLVPSKLQQLNRSAIPAPYASKQAPDHAIAAAAHGAEQNVTLEGIGVSAPEPTNAVGTAIGSGSEPNRLDVFYQHEPETTTGSLSLPTKFYRPDPSLPRAVSDRLFALGTKSNMQPFKLACVVEGFGEIAPHSGAMGKFLWSVIRALPDAHLMVVARNQTQVESSLSAVANATVLTPDDLRVLDTEVRDSLRGNVLSINDEETGSVLRLSMAWPALTKLIMGRAIRLPSGDLDFSLGQRAASEFLQNSLRSHPLDLESVMLLSVAALESFTIHDARVLYEDIRSLSTTLASEILHRELTIIEKAQLEFPLSDSDIRSMCLSLTSIGLLNLSTEQASHGEQLFQLSTLVRESATEIIASLSPLVRSSYLALTANFLIERARLDELLGTLVAFESWEVLNRVVESQWWELLELPTDAVRTLVEQLPADISRNSMKLHALSLALRDESETKHTSMPQTVLSALLGRAPERNRLCPETDFLGLTEPELVDLTDSVLTWGFSRFLAGDLENANAAYKVVETGLSAELPGNSKSAALNLAAYQAALQVLRGECHLVEKSRTQLELLANSNEGPASEIAMTVLNWQRNSQLESCHCVGDPADDAPASMLQGIRTASHNYCAMAGDNSDDSLHRLETALEALPAEGSQLLVRYLLTDAYAHVLMRLGRIPDARALLESASGATRFSEANARLAYLSGQFDEAIKIAERAQADTTTVPREAIALNTLIAVSAWEMKDPHLAFDALKTAYEHAKKNHVWLYFALIPRNVTKSILLRAPEIFKEIDAVVAGRYVDFPVPHKLGTLSPKEREVLITLSAEGSISATAKAMFLGVNTVKTHTRNIYRKLDVHSVAEAVAQAREFGLTQ